jgi:acyl carrier protein phosphodiesterase
MAAARKPSLFKKQRINYLAHAYLSFNHPEVLAGNMSNDFVKGKQQFTFSPGFQKGFVLHRAIDAFTDAHAATKALKAFFKPQYRLYAGAFADVVYDHFLACDAAIFPAPEALQQFAASTYDTLDRYRASLPQGFAHILPYIRQQNWLYHYRFTSGIQQSFHGLVRRAAYLSESDIAYDIFLAQYRAMGDCYTAFFPELKNHAIYQLQQLIAT